MNEVKNEKYATSVITDIRNFTGVFEKYQKKNSNVFRDFLEKYYKIQSDLAEIISDEVHMNSTGDGVLTVFMSDKSYIEGYAFLLLVHKGLKKLCKEFTKETGIKMSFGIGADSGQVFDVGKNMNMYLDTYVGTVINRTARIEAMTKMFADTKAAIGGHLYNKLLEELHPVAFDVMKNYVKKYDTLLHKHPEVVLVSKELMLYYIFEMVLKNIDKPLPLFRLSEYLMKNEKSYWDLIDKLLPKEKIEKIKGFIIKL